MTAVPSNAFADASAATIRSLTGDEIAIRPMYDSKIGRVVVQLAAAGFSVLLDSSAIAELRDKVALAAYLGEVLNVVAGHPTPHPRTRP
ncbi:hypothetical protein ABZZ79_01195 [Streptomyces sp. NPDC006458]|uniref:hypothetical protein n=1 Tax=Streptomyces sp. NPDC006458 TaxID=3154302 RepID=UPI0033AA0606